MTSVPFTKKASAAAAIRKLFQPSAEQPFTAMIEVSDHCNEVCVHCYQIQGQKGELTTEDWRSVMDELHALGVLFLTISGGEATLRKDFLELVRYARELKFAVKLYTNGLTMTEELADALAELAVQEVQISLYSHRPEVHDWVTRVPGSWKKTVEGAKHLIARDVGVLLKSPLMTFNYADRHAYADFVVALGADYVFDADIDPREDGDRGPQSFAITDEQWLEVQSDPRFSTTMQAPRRRSRTPDDKLCGACSGMVHVEPNGQLNPCASLNVPLGHAVEDGIRKSWSEGETAVDIRALRWRDIPGCRDCDLRDYCGRCFARSKRESGDALAPYEAACRRAQLQYRLVHGTPLEVGPDGATGPYRLQDNAITRLPLVRTDADRRLEQRLGWTRMDAAPSPVAAQPGQLVQIRRPGARKPAAETVPPLLEPARAEVTVDSQGSGRHTDRGLD